MHESASGGWDVRKTPNLESMPPIAVPHPDEASSRPEGTSSIGGTWQWSKMRIMIIRDATKRFRDYIMQSLYHPLNLINNISCMRLILSQSKIFGKNTKDK
jgi:hypothetical protein